MPTYIHERREWPHFRWDPDTALRDIPELVGLGILEKKAAGGRSTRYSLAGD